MCDIWDNADPIHLEHDLSSPLAQSAPSFLTGRRVDQVVGPGVGQRDVLHPQAVERLQSPGAPTQHISGLHTQDHGDLAAGRDAPHIVHAQGELDLVGVPLDDVAID